jgi:ectoine hydroxylase-related dioxygenase (phytanoyl-CoA dioxygenase family)
MALGTRSEVVGRRGDVFLFHPWTVHAGGQGLAGNIRILGNPNLVGRDAPYRPGPPRCPVEALIHEAVGQ